MLKQATAAADAQLIGWQYWQYKNWADPTTTGHHALSPAPRANASAAFILRAQGHPAGSGPTVVSRRYG
ncbi:MAG: hypothetical protein QM661_08190 [Solimonas sp.]